MIRLSGQATQTENEIDPNPLKQILASRSPILAVHSARLDSSTSYATIFFMQIRVLGLISPNICLSFSSEIHDQLSIQSVKRDSVSYAEGC